MDYNSMHGPGISNFSSPLSHRMPTVSAAQALQDLRSSPARCISTGLSALDCVLQNREPASSNAQFAFGGISRGKVTEVYGPPGVGKTALCIQLAASALHAGDGVVWIDASHPLSGSRLAQVLTCHQPTTTTSSPPTLTSLLSNLTHFSSPTLVHLLVLLTHPTPNNPPPNTSLIIIDSFSTPISNAFPRSVDSNATSRKPGAPSPSSRKFPILQHLISSLSKLAATRNIAIVITSQCMTKMRPGLGAVLVPAVNTTAWEQGLGCRVEILRDWGWEDEQGEVMEGVRLVRVLKAEGVVVPEGRVAGRCIGFGVGEHGLHTLKLPTHTTTQPSPLKRLHPTHNPTFSHITPTLPTLSHKRKLSATDLEIPDSDAEDDEDYGWAEEDEEELPPAPPQWQGSEDALAPALEGDGEGEEEGDDELLEAGMDGEEGKEVAERVVDDSEDELAL